jgi:uncharacterized membrane protein YjgN (DUF898 family)
MDAVTSSSADSGRAIEFTGTLSEYIPIAATNALLTLVTLFIYRPWAKARSRRYLWSRTRFIDDRLVWTGTGLEMFIGFAVVAILLGVAVILLNFGLPALALRIGPLAAAPALIALYLCGFYLYGLARFRALRYRLTRTWWHGIRGGSESGGWDYGRKAIGYYMATFFLAGIFYPWAQAKLWNERWGKMSFGTADFDSDMTTEETKGPFVILWLVVVCGSAVLALFGDPNTVVYGPGAPALVLPLLLYCAIGLAYLNFRAAYYQAAVDSTRVGTIEFGFDADFADWVYFYLRTIGLAIVTLGLAMLIYDFRLWRFVTSHMDAYGAVDLEALGQSRTTAPREAEGILDALDIGAF